MKKIFAITLIILLTCSLSFAVDTSDLFLNGLFNDGLSIAGLMAHKDNKSRDDKSIEKHFNVQMGKSLKIKLVTGGDIKITGWDKEELYAKADITGRNADHCRVDFKETAQGIEISSILDWNKKYTTGAGCSLEIKVPERFMIDFDNMGGDISIENIDGSINGETKGGMLSLNKLKGMLHLKTLGGNIELTDSDVDGSVSTLGGNVTIKDVTGDIKGSSLSGNVKYDNIRRRNGSEPEKEVQISSMGGDINVDTAPYGATVSTMGGDIIIGSVKDHLKATTMGGDINIKEADCNVNAKTMGGDIEIKVTGDANSNKHNIDLTSMSGEITLYVPSDLSMEIEIIVDRSGDRPRISEVISDFNLDMKEIETDQEDHDGNPRKELHAKGSFNGGKNRIQIKTMNGNVNLKKI